MPGTRSFHVLRHVFDAKNSDVLRNLGLPAKPGESSGSFRRFVFSRHALAVASASAPAPNPVSGPGSRFDTSCRCCTGYSYVSDAFGRPAQMADKLARRPRSPACSTADSLDSKYGSPFCGMEREMRNAERESKATRQQ